MNLFSKFHIKHPLMSGIYASLVASLLILFVSYLFDDKDKMMPHMSASNTNSQSVSGNIVNGDLIIQGQQVVTKNQDSVKNNQHIIVTTVTKSVKIGGNKSNNESLIGSGNKGNIFIGAQSVIISGNDNKDIIIKDSNSISLSGKNNVIYIINCKEININGNDNEIYVVEGTTKRKIDGSRNVIKQITTEDFRKLNLL